MKQIDGLIENRSTSSIQFLLKPIYIRQPAYEDNIQLWTLLLFYVSVVISWLIRNYKLFVWLYTYLVQPVTTHEHSSSSSRILSTSPLVRLTTVSLSLFWWRTLAVLTYPHIKSLAMAMFLLALNSSFQLCLCLWFWNLMYKHIFRCAGSCKLIFFSWRQQLILFVFIFPSKILYIYKPILQVLSYINWFLHEHCNKVPLYMNSSSFRYHITLSWVFHAFFSMILSRCDL